jgi:thiol:disulfide interchange protein
METIPVGYISRVAGVLLWFLGLIITRTVIYSSVATWVLATLLILAWIGILAFWATVLSRDVSGQPDNGSSRWTTTYETLIHYGTELQLDAKYVITNAKSPIMLSLMNPREN